MSTYFIGDVHGCYDELMQLLKRIQFNLDKDQLIFVGDLINRGPKSLEVLRFVRGLGEGAQVVLGNHDISLLAYALGIYHGRGSDYLDIMRADDSQILLDWLRQQPLLIADEDLGVIVSHAGIPPRWSLKEAKKHAAKVEKKLRSDKVAKYLRHAYQRGEDKWQETYDKYDKFRYRLNGLTRLRYCDEEGEPDFSDKCPVGEQQAGLFPWFELRKQKQCDDTIRLVFGHWAALSYYRDEAVICLDSGCAWGGKLTAVAFEADAIIKTQVLSLQKR